MFMAHGMLGWHESNDLIVLINDVNYSSHYLVAGGHKFTLNKS